MLHSSTALEDAELASLAGTRVVITGGSSGIGLATAQRVVASGGTVVLIGRDAARLAAARTLLGERFCETVELDVTNEAAVAETFDRLGSFDHLVTAAAGTVRGLVLELETAKARALFEAKYWGQYYSVKHGAPHINVGGSVVLFSGWISRKPMKGTSALAAVDAAIEALARTLSLELAPIRVNAVTPGMIDSRLWSARLSPEEQCAFFKEIGKALPAGRSGTPDDVAHAVQFFLENGFTTGAVLDVDGGQR